MDLPEPAALDPHDVLSQPTRARLFARLADLKRPAGTKELAEHLDLNPNGVRIHLGRLAEAGLVMRSTSPAPRGRPRHAWTIAPDARPGGDPPRAYSDLGRWLGRAIPARQSRLRDVESTGREIGRELAPRMSSGPKEAMLATFTALGFQPRVEPRAGDGVTYCLDNCPYRDVVRENQEVVCTLHRGITRGLIDVLDPGASLEAFVPGNPDKAGCLIEVSGGPRNDAP